MTEGNGEVRELPEGWCWVQHKTIAEINPKLPINDLDDDLTVSFLPMAAVEEKSGRYNLSEVHEYKQVRKGYTPFIDGDLIFAKITPCMENGKVAIVETLQNGIGFGSTEFHVSRLTSLTNKKYLFYYLIQEFFRRDAQQHMTGSAGQLRVPKSYFEEVKIPLAPLSEQERIVERIEELFSDLDHGIESLKTAQKQLKVYRKAVLKWAFEGKLTEQWREQAKQVNLNLKTGEELLAQIKTERENCYQQQLAEWEQAVKEWEEKGRSGKKPTKPRNSTKPSLSIDNASLPEIPNGWCWVRIGEIGNVQLGRQRSPQHHQGDYMRPYLRVANVFEDRIDTSDVLEMNFTPEEFKTYELKRGDILLNEGQSLELVGRSAIYKDEVPGACFQNTLVRFRSAYPISSEFCQSIFLYYFHSGRFQKIAKWTTSIAHLGAERFAELEFPLPPLEEQNQILEELSRMQSLIKNLEDVVDTNLQQTEALRQSILKQAFEGKLVPQDPNDEPAEKLLERIRAERQTNGNTGKGSKPKHQQLTLEEV